MKKFLVFIVVMCLGMSSMFAQTIQVSGTVTSADDGGPLPGVSVMVVGSIQGTVTNASGKYTFSVPSDAVLQFSFVGMTTQEIPVTGRQIIDVVMELSAQSIDDVIIVAYGTATKSSFTGSASTVKSEQLASRSVSNITNALSGQTAGVQVSNRDGGQPGTAATIRIRGFGSFTASSAPLYVIDGTPYEGNLSAINMSDIENMTVLKDAAANAIYGARGANGVVLLTTKKGSTHEAKVTVDARWGSNSKAVPNYAVMKDPAMYYETMYKSLFNSRVYNENFTEIEAYEYADDNLFSGRYQVYTVPQGQKLIGSNFKMNPNATLGYDDGEYYYLPDDWYKETFGKSNLRQEYNVSVSGFSEKLNYYISAGYLDDNGIIPSSGFSRYTALAKADYQAKKWLKVGSSLALSQYNMKSPTSQLDWGSSGNIFYNTNMIAPIYPMYVRTLDTNGKPYIMKDAQGQLMYDYGNTTNFVRSFLPMSNPLGSLALDNYSILMDALISRWYAILTPVEGLTITANLGANVLNRRYSYLYNPFHGGSSAGNGQAVVEHNRDFEINQQYLASYTKKFGIHNFDVLVGYESFDWTMQQLGGSRQNLYNPKVGELSNGIQWPPTDMYSSTDKYVTMGFLSRVQYNYDSKYFASASFRRDASSRFHPDNRWGNFGSIGLAWLISKENFFYSFSEYVDMLKLKLSYGVQGNDKLSTTNYYNYADQFTIQNDGNDGFSLVPSINKGNKDITWETSYSWNGGADFELFNSRLNGSLEYFHRITKDMLYNKPLAVSSGFRFMPINALDMVNNGIEIDLTGVVLKNRDIEWSVFANFTWFRNRILKVPQKASETQEIKTSTYILKKGASIYNAYMREWAGVDPETGKGIFYLHDPAKDPSETTDNTELAPQVDLGPTYAPCYGGFGTNLEAYGFDFGIQFAYQLGGRLYDDIYQEFMHSGQSSMSGYNWHKDILNAWTSENRNTDVPRLSASDDIRQLTSSRFLTSSNYLSLNNVVLGYTFPEKWVKAAKIASLRIYVSGDNLVLLSARQGFDPRANIALGGTASDFSSNSVYSLLRTFSGGISLTF